MDFELKAAKAKWEREQKEKKDRARARLEQERRAREQAAAQRQAIEEAQRLRRIEAAQAALAAEQQEQEDIQLGDGVRYNKTLRAFRVSGDGDKITLPASDFEELSSQNAFDKGPMFFQISRESGGRTTHCGVMEFTAEEGSVGLPVHVWKNADLIEGSEVSISSPQLVGSHGKQMVHMVQMKPHVATVRVRYVRLPKGEYAKLQAEGRDFADVPNHKAVLETKLRQHAALSEGDLLTVHYGGTEYHLRVLELKPASAVSVIETDIEVDVVGSSGSVNNEDKLVQLEFGKAEKGTVEEGKYKYYKFNVDKSIAEAANKGDTEIVVRLQVDGGGSQADADIYVAAHPVLFPSRDEHQWASHNTGTKIVSITAAGAVPGVYTIGVYGFRGKSSFVLDVEAREKSSGQKLGAAQGQHAGDGYEACNNCGQMIPTRTIALHEAYCRRHNVPCPYPGCGVVLRKEEAGQHVHCSKCGQAFRQDDLDKHMSVFHVAHTCTCGAVLEMQEMVKHKATVCPHRKITCRFCGDVVQAEGDAVDLRDRLRGFTQHESSCGSRTDECDVCHRSVMLKDMELHRAAVHSGPPKQASTIVTRDSNTSGTLPTRNTLDNAGPNIIETVCPICEMKFQGVEAVNLHIENEHFGGGGGSPSRSPSFSPTPASDSPVPVSNFRQTMSVLCPICGMAVHSERDLSSHIDMVH